MDVEPAGRVSIEGALAACVSGSLPNEAPLGLRIEVALTLMRDGTVYRTLAPYIPGSLGACVSRAFADAQLELDPAPRTATGYKAVVRFLLELGETASGPPTVIVAAGSELKIGEVDRFEVRWDAPLPPGARDLLDQELRMLELGGDQQIVLAFIADTPDRAAPLLLAATERAGERRRLARATKAGWSVLPWLPFEGISACERALQRGTVTIENRARTISFTGARAASFPATTEGIEDAARLLCDLRAGPLSSRSDLYLRPTGGTFGVLADLIDRAVECGFADVGFVR